MNKVELEQRIADIYWQQLSEPSFQVELKALILELIGENEPEFATPRPDLPSHVKKPEVGGAMNVASQELCDKLYQLSGWDNEYWYHDDQVVSRPFSVGASDTPAYDLGYLLRKFPAMSYIYKHGSGRGYSAKVTNLLSTAPVDTPEDAAAKLAIDLFEQGILIQESR